MLDVPTFLAVNCIGLVALLLMNALLLSTVITTDMILCSGS
jgi:hypothetical protein